MKVSYFPGCTLKTKAKDLDRYARSSAEALGVTLEEIEDWQCCGGVFSMAKDEIATKLSSVRALKAAAQWEQPLVTVCSACHNVIKQTNHAMQTDADFALKVNNYLAPEAPYQGETRVLHYLELLRDVVGFDQLKAKVVKPLSLIHIYQGEVIVQGAADDLIAGLGDGGEFFRGHLLGLEGMVGQSRRLLEDSEGMGDFPGHGFDAHADLEVLVAALGLCAPVAIRGNLHLAHGIVLDAVGGFLRGLLGLVAVLHPANSFSLAAAAGGRFCMIRDPEGRLYLRKKGAPPPRVIRAKKQPYRRRHYRVRRCFGRWYDQ